MHAPWRTTLWLSKKQDYTDKEPEVLKNIFSSLPYPLTS